MEDYIKQRRQLLGLRYSQCNPSQSLVSKSSKKDLPILITNLHLGIEIFGGLLWPLCLARALSSATTSGRATTGPVRG